MHEVCNLLLAPRNNEKLAKSSSSVNLQALAVVPETKKQIVERKVYLHEDSCRRLLLPSSLTNLVLNTHSWFRRVILKPLAKEIKLIDSAFARAGLEHLDCRYPATFTASYSISFSKPRTLSELSLSHGQDQNVIRRIRIEKYLSLTDTFNSRQAALNIIDQFSKEDLDIFSSSATRDNFIEVNVPIFLFLAFHKPILHFHGQSILFNKFANLLHR